MRKIIIVLFSLFLFTTITAQFTSVQNGAFHIPGTWSTDPNATAIPDSNSSVIINHTIWGSGECRDLTINENGKIYSGEGFTIYGNLNNIGEIRDDPNHGSDYLTVTIYGNIINNGVYITGTTNFKGSEDHHLQSINGNTINFGSAFGRNSDATFIVDGVAYISGSLLLNGSKMILPGGSAVLDTLVLKDALIDGGVVECNNNVILGMGVNSTISFNGIFDEQRQTFLKDVILDGYLNFNGSSSDSTAGTITFLGNVINNGTIITKPHNSGNYANIFIEGEFTNNGIVQSESRGLDLRFVKNGNITNNGELLDNKMIFYGSHTFVNNNDSIGVSEIKGLDSNSTVTIVGDLISNHLFNGSYYTVDINMNGGKIILPNNGKLINFRMDNTILEANNSLLANTFPTGVKTSIVSSTIVDAKIKYAIARNPTIFLGNLEIVEDGLFRGHATLNCNILNNGDMKVNGAIIGDIINNGTWEAVTYLTGNITNSSIINSYMEISGNLTNKGSWEGFAILLNGNEDQVINMPTDSTIHSSSIKFDAMLDGTNYQWRRNGVDIAGENGNVLTLLTDLLPDNATYNCKVDGATSRNIIIQSLTDVDDEKDVKTAQLPTEFSLSQNYPNPFNPSTEIDFALPSNSNVSLKVFNSLGEEVAELVNREMTVGYHSVNFDASNLSSGIYFYRINVGSFVQTNKMILVK